MGKGRGAAAWWVLLLALGVVLRGLVAADEEDNRPGAHGYGDEDRCQRRCARVKGQSEWQQCMRDCRRPHLVAADVDRDSNVRDDDRCQRQCRHLHGQQPEWQQCMRQCRRHHSSHQGHGGPWETTVAGAILQVV